MVTDSVVIAVQGLTVETARDHGRDQGPAQGEGAGFVEQHGLELGSHFDRIATAEQQPAAGRQARAHGDHRGGGQAEGAGASHHEHGNGQLQRQGERRRRMLAQHPVTAMGHGAWLHGAMGRQQHLGPEAATPLPPEDKGGGGQAQHPEAETARHPVGQALDRGLAGLGPLNQGHDPCNSTVGTAAQHLELQHRLKIETACRQLDTRGRLDGQGFTRECRHIDAAAAIAHHRINRHPIAGSQQNAVARPQAAYPEWTGQARTQQQLRGLRLQLRQLLQSPAGAVAGTLLEEATTEHEAQQHHGLIEKAGPAAGGPQQSDHAGQIGTGQAHAHQAVHARHAMEQGPGAIHQDRPARSRQGNGGHQRVKPEVGQQGGGWGRRQLPQHGQMAQARDQHQGQRHHQLTPLLPPVALLQPPQAAGGIGVLLITRMGSKAEALQRIDQPRQGLPRGGLQIDPGGSAEQIDAGFADARLLQQLLLDGAHAAAAFHALDLEQQRRHGTTPMGLRLVGFAIDDQPRPADGKMG